MFGNGFNGGPGNAGDFEAMARQYWSAWGQAMRQGGLGAAAPAQPASQWQQAVDWWTQLMPGGPSQANDAVARFNQQASQWFGQMQQVAAQFAGQDNSASEIGQAWRRAMGANADNPFPDMLFPNLFKAMRGQGAHGLDEWLDQVKPYLEGFRQQAQHWQHLPAFGQYREHQERWQALQLAQQDYQHQTEAFNALMMKCAQRAFDVFEDKLTAHEEPGRQLTSARALFDLWIDSAEQAYAEIALSAEFREVYGALTNAQMRLRAAIQLEVEHLTGLFGMPTRTEIDSAHRKIADLERALRRAGAAGARPAAERRAAPAPRVPAPEPVAASAKAKSRRKLPKKVARQPQPVRKPASKRTAPRKTAARKLAAKPATVEQQVPGKKIPKKAAAKKAVAPSRKAAATRHAPAKQPVSTKTAVKAASAPSGNGRVVSMKDWVARYAAANTPDGPALGKQKNAGKKVRK
ncbi:class III poly(R)-hydroxyalkanoic acid synthase subunit PhaE [Pseudoxanthomonas sacheonensis]|uniref:class III poly(R)-hydroxyalkanoic acid synthase subunit PhaE n=1 Tax=Pseudoxanthomonas sacheonensis TaxID=443615 RepID=UPI0013D8A08F|nr:class III poly(R)-hydroxyalkanoic acid synthase subunit PhaE [Pseudoxanthomonas sacheonensis]KAF1707854.1 class III poly(R)-hydroxyalkanoic acid synthase subunit PhaE [Pseudoxanthomonas sacheonensis]